MKRRIAAVILLMVIFASVLTACSGEKKEKSVAVEGKYKSMVGYILLNEDKTFMLESTSKDNKMAITGKYAITDKKIEFNVEKMNGQEVGNVTYGTIEGDSIIGPDKVRYTKE